MHEMGSGDDARHERLLGTLLLVFLILAVAAGAILWAIVEWLSEGPGF